MIEYYKIFIMFIICVIVAIILLGASYVLKTKNYNWEKISSYECGFQPFEDARNKFDIKFYLVAILFIIFDLEVSYLFPWGIYLNDLDFYGFWWMMLFLFILTIGFVYEWMKGALNWD